MRRHTTRFVTLTVGLALVGLCVLSGCGDDDGAGVDAAGSNNANGNDNTNANSNGNELPPPVVSIEFTEVERFTIADQPAHLAFPDVARLADGRLLVVYREGAAHVDAGGRIMSQLGSADAQTWTAPQVLYDEPGMDDRDPSVAVLPSGQVVVTYFQYQTVDVAGSTLILHQIFASTSEDNGASFGSFSQLSEGHLQPPAGAALTGGLWVDGQGDPILVHACSSPLAVIDGTWILPTYGGQTLNLADLPGSPRSRISLHQSGDGGSTWSRTEVIPAEAPTVWLQEPALISLLSGRQLLHVRTATGASPSSAGSLGQTHSDNGGLTWSDWEAFDFSGHAPYLLQLENGVVLSAFREINAAFTQEWTSFVHSLDDGLTWSIPLRVEDCGAVECGYPSLVELDGGRLLMVYYSAGGVSIDAVIFSFQAFWAD